jgi:cytochrome c
MPSELRFVLILSALTAAAGAVSVFGIYREDGRETQIHAEVMTGGQVDAGKAVIARYNCSACHRIPGIAGAAGAAGPALNGIAVRADIAGMLANNPENLVRWLRHPERVLPGNGMPDQGVSEREARDIAAYLYTLRRWV